MIPEKSINKLKSSVRYAVFVAIILMFFASMLGGCIAKDADNSEPQSHDTLWDSYTINWNESYEWTSVMGMSYQNSTSITIDNSSFISFNFTMEARFEPVPFNPEGYLNFTITRSSGNDTDGIIVVWSEEWNGENSSIMTDNMSMVIMQSIIENDTIDYELSIRALGRDSGISGGSQDYFITTMRVVISPVVGPMEEPHLN